MEIECQKSSESLEFDGGLETQQFGKREKK